LTWTPEEEHEYYQWHLLSIRDISSQCEQDLPAPPSGSNGLMLGEIMTLGLSAGLTRVELTLFLFFGLRASFKSGFLPFAMENAGLVGVEQGSIMGLGLPERAAPGVLRGFSLGVFRAARRGVFWSSSCMAVSNLNSVGVSNEASGRLRSCIMGGASTGSP
jgi:hypothetical protein